MRLIGICVAVASFLALSVPAYATTYDFHEDGFIGAAGFSGDLIGSFTGTDNNNDGYIHSGDGEVTAFSASFNGEQITIHDLIGLIYHVGDSSIMELPNELVLYTPGLYLNQSAGAYGVYTCGTAGGLAACSNIYNHDKTVLESISSAPIQVSVVSSAPEPTGWALMLVGVGIAGTAIRRSNKSRAKLVKA